MSDWKSRDPLVIDNNELRHSIIIQSPPAVADTFGNSVVPAGPWVNVRSTWSAIYTAGGKETSQASQIVSEVSHVVKVRWTSMLIKANYRVVFGARYFTISYVENVLERNRVMLLYCLEVDGGGQ